MTPRLTIWLIAIIPALSLAVTAVLCFQMSRLRRLRREREAELLQEKARAEEMATELANVNSMLEQSTVWAKEMAAQSAMSNAAKSDFLASMSHEIRTPMNGVLGMLTLLEQTPLNAEQLDYVQTIRYSGETLLEIINQILDFSRVESGKIDLEEIDFSPRHEVEEAIVLFGEKAEAKGIELIAAISDSVPEKVRGDPGRFRQILINLVGNAIKFTERGEIAVEVQSGPVQGGTELAIAVLDTGIGMPANVVKKLFHPFYQGDGSTRRRFGGTGLGLAISKKLIETMKGAIEVRSAPGKGTTFQYTLRMRAAGNSTTEPDPAKAILAGKSALLVCGNRALRAMAATYMTSWGMKIAEAENAEQAGSFGNAGAITFIVSDCPVDELERLRHLAQSWKTAERPAPALVLFASPRQQKPAQGRPRL